MEASIRIYIKKSYWAFLYDKKTKRERYLSVKLPVKEAELKLFPK